MNKLAKIEIEIIDNSCPIECYLDKITKTIFLNTTFKELTSAVGPDDWMRNTSVQISHKISLEDFLRIILSKNYDIDQLSSKSVDELLYMDDKLAKLFSDKL